MRYECSGVSSTVSMIFFCVVCLCRCLNIREARPHISDREEKRHRRTRAGASFHHNNQQPTSQNNLPYSIDRRRLSYLIYHQPKMGFLSSKTLIKGHALFVFTLAVYLTKSPEVVTESDVVFMLGELLRLVQKPFLPPYPFETNY